MSQKEALVNTPPPNLDQIEKTISKQGENMLIKKDKKLSNEKEVKLNERIDSIYHHKIPTSFLANYIWNDFHNRIWILAGIVLLFCQLYIFKVKFPFANYMPDSYSYISAAFNNADVNMWPVAYSKYLRLISVFTHSDKIVVGLQYISIQISALLFLFSLMYFINPGKLTKIVLLLFTILNPLPLYIANYISADALFISLSLLWMTSLVWIIYCPKSSTVFTNGLLLLACFTVRYNAIYYPVISLVIILCSRQKWKIRIAGISFALALVGFSYLYTSNKMKQDTGTLQFSAFGGWQLANNALYMYEHVQANQREEVPARFAKLEKMVREHLDTLKKVKMTPLDSANGYFYLWNPFAPLVAYMNKEYQNDTVTAYFKKWASEGQLYRDYAMLLIKRYPKQYAFNYMLPNAIKYAVPPTEFLGIYNMGADSVAQLAKDWFNYKTTKVQDHKKMTKFKIVDSYRILGTITNIILVMSIIGTIVLGIAKRNNYGFQQLLLMVSLFWLLNSSFSIFASSIVLRYEAFPILVFFIIGSLLTEKISIMAFTKEKS